MNTWGPVISADLCMSPCSPDFLFELISARSDRLALSL